LNLQIGEKQPKILMGIFKVLRDPRIATHLVSKQFDTLHRELAVAQPGVEQAPFATLNGSVAVEDTTNKMSDLEEASQDAFSLFPSIAPYKAAQLFLEEDKAKLGA